jgi:Zn-dependent M32 family carboxypeptidase
MNPPPNDPRDIPVLTEAIDGPGGLPLATLQAAQLAIVTETLKIADALLHQAARDMEASLFERVYDRLKAQLPDLVEKILHEHLRELPTADAPKR